MSSLALYPSTQVFSDVEHELAVLSNNAIEVIDDMSDYLL